MTVGKAEGEDISVSPAVVLCDTHRQPCLHHISLMGPQQCVCMWACVCVSERAALSEKLRETGRTPRRVCVRICVCLIEIGTK